MTLKDIEKKMADAINKTLGIDIKVTNYDIGKWSIMSESHSKHNVKNAVNFLVTRCGMTFVKINEMYNMPCAYLEDNKYEFMMDK